MRPMVIEARRFLLCVALAFAAGVIATVIEAAVVVALFWPEIRAELEERVLGRLLVDCVPVEGEVVRVVTGRDGYACERQAGGRITEVTLRVR